MPFNNNNNIYNITVLYITYFLHFTIDFYQSSI